MSSPTNCLQCDKEIRHRQVNVNKSNYDKFWSIRINKLEAQLGKKVNSNRKDWRDMFGVRPYNTERWVLSPPFITGSRLQTVGDTRLGDTTGSPSWPRMSLDCMGLGDFSHSPKEGCKSLPKSVKDKISSLWQGDCCPPPEADTSSPLYYQRLANNCSSSFHTSGMGKTSWAKYRNLT